MLAIGERDISNIDLCLAARALGASEITFTGKSDKQLLSKIKKMNIKWGGKFKVSFTANYKDLISRSEKAIKIYLTRYGTSLNEKARMISTYKNIILIVTQKDDVEYVRKNIADFNVSITRQPHCSSAAVAIFLHEYYKGRELAMHFENAKYKIDSASK